MGRVYQKVTRVSRTHRTPSVKKTTETPTKRIASRRSANARTRKAIRRI